MSRVALGISYDGSAWYGWQRQPVLPSVQSELENALLKFVGQPVAVCCAGRTDRGVHALNQVVHLDPPVKRSAKAWVSGLNAFLPSSISVQWAQEVDENFHARFSARERTYFYVLREASVRSPLLDGKVGWVFRPLDLERMRRAAELFVGTHDFSSFRSTDCQAKSPVREIYTIDIQQSGSFYVFRFVANAFLHHMVRNLMGTLLYVGYGRLDASDIPTLIERRDRQYAPPTFAPDGLYLAGVKYEEAVQLPMQDPLTLFQQHLGPWIIPARPEPEDPGVA